MVLRFLVSLFGMALVGAALAACGGADDPDVRRVRVTLVSEAIRDGTVRSDGQVETGRHTLSGDQNVAGVGDDDMARETRMFFSFDTSGIPAGATIRTATLSFRQILALNQVLLLNPMLIELLDYGDTLEAADFALAPGSTPTSVTLNNLNIVRTFDITAVVQTNVAAGAARTQFRLRMQGGTNGDGVSDVFGLETADNDWGSTDRPELFVEYDTPAP